MRRLIRASQAKMGNEYILFPQKRSIDRIPAEAMRVAQDGRMKFRFKDESNTWRAILVDAEDFIELVHYKPNLGNVNDIQN